MSDRPKKQLAINAAFFNDIKEDREELMFIERRMKYLLDEPQLFSENMREFRELTEVFRDQLALHFALEEAYGYFEEALEVAPRLHQQSLKLRSQHTELYQAAQRLCDAAYREPPLECEELARRAKQLLVTLDEHETAETQMIQAALNDDMGGGD